MELGIVRKIDIDRTYARRLARFALTLALSRRERGLPSLSGEGLGMRERLA